MNPRSPITPRTAPQIILAARDRPRFSMEAFTQNCARRGWRMTPTRRLIARVLEGASDHPDVEEIHRRAQALDRGISVATVYRTMKLFEDLKLVVRHRFGDGPSRYELAAVDQHDHLIDMESGKVIEFSDPRIDAVQRHLASELGYVILSYRLEIFAVPSERATQA